MMNKTWTIIEKIIGILLGIWGIVALYSVTITIANMINQGYITANHITYFQLFLGGHINFFLAVAIIVGGFMLVSGDKAGWFLAVICCALYIVTFFRSSQANTISTQPYYAFAKSYSAMALLFFIILILLIQKSFIKKYHVTLKTWLWVIAIVILVSIDKFFLR